MPKKSKIGEVKNISRRLDPEFFENLLLVPKLLYQTYAQNYPKIYIQLSDNIISLIVFAREHVVGFNSRQSRYQYVQRISHSRTKKETKQKNKNFSLKGITSVSVKFDHISNVKENGIKCRIGGKSVAENISVFTKPRSCNTTF